jgi:N-glycosylase/DNA lyase
MTISTSGHLHVEYTLICGQSFRWSQTNDGWWASAMQTADGPVVVKVRQDQLSIASEEKASTGVLAYIKDYFRLNVVLEDLSKEFLAADETLAQVLRDFQGLRVLRQDPVECLFSFLCTSAAPLHRIRKSVNGLSTAYGTAISCPNEDIYYTFPTVERLALAEVDEMRAIGLGYRARFVKATAEAVVERGGSQWLHALRGATYADAHLELCKLPGVGAKIADCVCLFSLDKDQAIPVDTHIWQVAVNRYGIAANAKSLTPAVYKEIGDSLRDRFGPYAGWAQQYLFFADLYGRGAWESYVKQLRQEDGAVFLR